MRLAASLFVPPDVSEALGSIGIFTDIDLLFGAPPHELLTRLPPGAVSLRQLQAAIESISAASSSKGLSVDDLLSTSDTNTPIALASASYVASCGAARTGLSDLDCMLGGDGFAAGRVYEIAGDKATGKTCLALSTVIHHLVSHEDCHAWWVDTTGGFTVEKALQTLGEATVDASSTALERFEVSLAFDVSTMFDVLQSLRMVVFRKIRFLVIDSIWALLSPLFSSFSAQGHAIMTDMMQQLRQCAQDMSMTVLVLNNSSSLKRRDGPKAPSLSAFEGTSRRPALGPSFQFMTDTTLWLSRAGDIMSIKTDEDEDLPLRDANEENMESGQDSPDRFVCEVLRSRISPSSTWCTFTIQNYVVRP